MGIKYKTHELILFISNRLTIQRTTLFITQRMLFLLYLWNIERTLFLRKVEVEDTKEGIFYLRHGRRDDFLRDVQNWFLPTGYLVLICWCLSLASYLCHANEFNKHYCTAPTKIMKLTRRKSGLTWLTADLGELFSELSILATNVEIARYFL